MRRLILGSAALLMLTIGRTPTCLAHGLQDDVEQSATVIERFRDMPERGIPEAVLRDAKGLAILTTLKAGFVFSGEGGRGVVIARTPRGWSGPSAIGTGGARVGFPGGAEGDEMLLRLHTPS